MSMTCSLWSRGARRLVLLIAHCSLLLIAHCSLLIEPDHPIPISSTFAVCSHLASKESNRSAAPCQGTSQLLFIISMDRFDYIFHDAAFNRRWCHSLQNAHTRLACLRAGRPMSVGGLALRLPSRLNLQPQPLLRLPAVRSLCRLPIGRLARSCPDSPALRLC
jgi:hypothetical protein